MKINKIDNISYKGLYNNKIILNGLEQISNHSASFIAATSLVSATLLRPLAINLTPKVDDKNKKIFTTESIASGLTKFLIAESVVLPIENSLKKIEKNPKDYLKKSTLENVDSGKIKFLNHFIKQFSSFVTSIPKSILTVALIPILMDILYKKDNKKVEEKSSQPTFTGLTKMLAKVVDSQVMQDFSNKYHKTDKNLTRNMSVASDIFLTTTSVYSTIKSKKIDDKQKKSLATNKIISTALSIIFGCSIDKLVQNGSKKFIEKFSQINKNNPKLEKYLDGINILRPTAIFALIYYVVLPVVSTLLTEKYVNNDKDSK